MHIFVINLEKDRARRESIQKQLEELNLSHEFFPGVLGSALSQVELAKCYNDLKAKWNRGSSLTPAEIGCALSHLGVYREIIRRQLGCALILEDDVILNENLPQYLSQLELLMQKDAAEVILLSPAEGWQQRQCRQIGNGGWKIIPFMSGFYASSYVITQYAACALLKELYPVGDVADCWERLKRYRVVDIFMVSPPLTVQNQTEFGSSTTGDIQKRGFLFGWRKLVHKGRRAVTKFLDFFYGFYRRHFVPYSGVKLPIKNSRDGDVL
jgi:glycosyl transferase family 25